MIASPWAATANATACEGSDAARDEHRRTCAGLGRGACGCDRERRGGRGRAEEGERERDRSVEGKRVQQHEERGAADEPRQADERPGLRGLARRRGVVAEPASEPETGEPVRRAPSSAARARPRLPRSRRRRRRSVRRGRAPSSRRRPPRCRERRESGTVDQPEEQEREADTADAGARARIATDDRDPHELVEAARKRDAGDGRSPACRGERQRRRSLVRSEQRLQPSAFRA